MSDNEERDIQDLRARLASRTLPLDEQTRAREELFSRVLRVIPGARSLEYLERYGDHSGALVFLAWETSMIGEKYVVLKVDDVARIDREKSNWEQYVRYLGRAHAVQLIGSLPGVLVYDTASTFPQVPRLKHRDFGDHYDLLTNPGRIVAFLFENVLAPWHSKFRPRVVDLSQHLHERIKAETNLEIRSAANQLLRADLNQPTIDFFEATGEPYSASNPFMSDFVHWKECRRIVPVSVVHGDLNAKNILFFPSLSLVYREQQSGTIAEVVEDTHYPCLIDFYRTREDILFLDPARLEVNIKFQLSKIRNLAWADLITFEDALTQRIPVEDPSLGLLDAPVYQVGNPLNKALSAVGALRERVNHVLTHGHFSPLCFWVCLYADSLETIKYEDLSAKQRLYAILSACMIFKRHILSELGMSRA